MIGGAPTVEVLASKSKWLNVCKFLEEEKGVGFYHRGFPLDQRWSKEETSDVVTKVRKRGGMDKWCGRRHEYVGVWRAERRSLGLRVGRAGDMGREWDPPKSPFYLPSCLPPFLAFLFFALPILLHILFDARSMHDCRRSLQLMLSRMRDFGFWTPT
mmetsp:Transcript_33982/g.87246  ORF Transcript_33982/g.87246 Transcript_33982/m.87246 type:complete len:157 (-) Transcript_33982:1308-1778(-)